MPRLNNRWRKLLKKGRTITRTMLVMRGAPTNWRLVLKRYGYRSLDGVLWERRSPWDRKTGAILYWPSQSPFTTATEPLTKEDFWKFIDEMLKVKR